MKLSQLFACAAAAASLAGCVSNRSAHGYVLERGETGLTGLAGVDSKESVLAKYGEPSLIGTFDRNAWYYVSALDASRAFFRPDTTARTVVAFHFAEDGKVERVDTLDLSAAVDVKMADRETPTRGKELGFWEQLLGNVGQLPAGGLGGQGGQGGPN
jgi:outer membrane protein assembly factor BamE (lipoprotein component of BamABCDE complex)